MNAKFLSRSKGLLDVGSYQLPFTIKLSKRIKQRYSYRLDPTLGLLVTIPKGSDPKAALELLNKKQAWLVRAIELQTPQGNILLGDPLSITFDINRQDGFQLVDGRLVLPCRGEDKAKQVASWYKQQAQEYLERRLPELANRLGVTPHKISLKDQRTRWGSCSSKRNLNFNWRLIMAPPFVFDATIIHELAHLSELNHSARFWTIVREHCPQYLEAKSWLKEHGSRIRAWHYVQVKEGSN
ncbi:MAG: SprT family zinc-dependent metalloprotease [Bacillota bacterium]|nr:SprT family zinc-dependent metalloprotease [Bacillota bacterium]